MIKNYLVVAQRHLSRNKLNAAIRILGLALAICCFSMIVMFVENEWSYDRFHKNAHHLYRTVRVSDNADGGASKMAVMPYGLAEAIRGNVPEAKAVARVTKTESVVRIDGDLFKADVLFVDPDFLGMFDVDGGESVLDAAGKVVLSQSGARRLFRDEDALGKRFAIKVGNTFKDIEVVSVVSDPPDASSLKFELLVPFAEQFANPEEADAAIANWRLFAPNTFVLLHEDSDVESVEEKLNGFIDSHVDPAFGQGSVELRPFVDSHFEQDVLGTLEAASDPRYSWILLAIGGFILMIAGINFTTISLAGSLGRSREVGIRKTFGGSRKDLIGQFMGESMLMAGLALVLGVLLVELMLPSFNEFTGKQLHISGFLSPVILFTLIAVTLAVAFGSGSYPAFFVSRFHPVEALSGRLHVSGRQFSVFVLLVVQFFLAVILITSTLIMTRQVNFLFEVDLGYEYTETVRLEVPHTEGAQILARLRPELTKLPGVAGVGGSWGPLPSPTSSTSEGLPVTSGEQTVNAHPLHLEPDLISLLRLEIVAGSPFSSSDGASPKVLVNEAFVRAAGWDEPIGRRLSMFFMFDDAEVVGVVKDFNIFPLYEGLSPAVIYPTPRFVSNIYVKAASGRMGEVIEHVRQSWPAVAPDVPLSYHFVDDEVRGQYQAEQRWLRIFRSSSVVAVFLACLGLLGLAMLGVSRRVREISIRKVLGASAAEIAWMLSLDFLKPVALGFLLAMPLSIYAASRWLEGFAYRVDIGAAPLIVAALVTFVVAQLAVSGQSFKAASTNPVVHLKRE